MPSTSLAPPSASSSSSAPSSAATTQASSGSGPSSSATPTSATAASAASPSSAAPPTITYQPPDALRPDPRNAGTHPKRQVQQIVASIREFGFANHVLVDETGTIIAGHGRLLAAKEMGLAEVPTIRLAGLSET